MTSGRTVLGWTQGHIAYPAPVVVREVGPLGILLVPDHLAATPRTRLQLQMQCFENEIGFIPTAPSLPLSEDDGLRFARARRAELLDALVQFDGLGQLTLSMTWKFPTKRLPKRICGRDWLRKRQELHSVSDQLARTALAFFDGCANPVIDSRTRQQNQRVERDILISKRCLDGILNGIRKHADEYDADGLSLTVTGLWPPFSFVQSFSGNKEAVL